MSRCVSRPRNNEELDAAIEDAMATVYGRLNIVQDPTTGAPRDERHAGVQAIEKRISDYISETFEDIGISLEFPNPGSRAIFDGAIVWVEEAGFGKFQVGNVGEGVKRVLIFSLFRTLADLRHGRLSVSETGNAVASHQQPLLILYEEAELFLHPGLQKILLRALQGLVQAGDQVIFTTHSPFMVNADVLSSINLLTKKRVQGSTAVEFHTQLGKRTDRERDRLLQVQHVSAYIFADRVLLVEGDSDRIVLQKIASRLNESWDCDRRGIPVLSVAGKGDLALFRQFLRSLGIKAFVVTDIDSVEDEIAKLCDDAEVEELRGEVLAAASAAATSSGPVNKSTVKKLVSSWSWAEVFKELAKLHTSLAGDGGITEEQKEALGRLLGVAEENARVAALRNPPDELKEQIALLADLLIEHNILLLRGSLEDYYPAEQRTSVYLRSSSTRTALRGSDYASSSDPARRMATPTLRPSSGGYSVSEGASGTRKVKVAGIAAVPPNPAY